MSSLNCKICNKEFKVYPYQIKKGKKFCGTKCAGIYKSEHWKEFYGNSFKKIEIKQECKICSKKFMAAPYRIKEGEGKFCSRDCTVMGRNGINKRNKKIASCLTCKKDFEIKNSRVKTAKYCSLKCYTKYGDINPFYKKNHVLKSKIAMSSSKQNISPTEWKSFASSERALAMGTPEYKQWRIAVFKRDNYTCQWCGQVGRELNADHIKPWALYPELRLELSNGRTLCLSCHKKTSTYLNSFGKNQYV